MSTNDSIDLGALLPNITDSLGDDTPPACSSATIGFNLHRAAMGNQYTLVKIYAGLPMGSLDTNCGKRIAKAFLHELGFWKQNCSTEHFARIIGHSSYADSILPSLIYQETIIAKDYLIKSKDTNIIQFLLHIAKGISYIHEKGIAHGDIRGDTILVDNEGLPRIGDPGLPRIISLLDRMGLKGKTEVMAAIRWMPPEIVRVDKKILFKPTKEGDIWSFGMTIFELGYRVPPYSGISLWQVPQAINEDQLPKPPNELSPNLDQHREIIDFLCTICWRKHPAARATISQLVKIMRELINGRGLYTLREEYEVDNQLSGNRTWGSRFHKGSSVASSDTLSSPDTYSISTASTRGSESGSSTAASSSEGTVRGSSHVGNATVKKEEVDDGSFVSGSNESENGGLKGNANDALRSTGNVQYTMFGQKGQGSNTKPFSAYPPPPSPESPWASIGSFKTALMNYKAKNKISSLHLTQTSVGEDHHLMWTTVCMINGIEYGRSRNLKKKSADEEAARQALSQISKEDPNFTTDGSPSYLSTFKTYLAANDLQGRIEMVSEGYGIEHSPTWECKVMRDGILLARGVDITKKKAEEKAVKNVVAAWNDTSV